MFNWISQIFAVTQFSLRSLPQRMGSSVAAMLGIAGVVAVMVGVLSIAQGVLKTMESSVGDDNAIVLRSGSDSEMMSGLSGDDARIITEASGIARDENGALASPELFVIINLPMRSTGTDANVPLRGVKEQAMIVRDKFKLVQGRMFEWGLNEVIVGVGARQQFRGLDIGSSIEVGKEKWPVVGIFEANGGLSESEIWVDAAVLQPAYRRGNSFQAVYVKLSSREMFDEFKDSLTSNPRLDVKPMLEAEYYASQSTTIYNMITGLGSLIAIIMGLGAVFGALNTMYTAISSRTQEIATLRALGFHSGPVIISVLTESLLLAFAGGLIGAGLAWLAFDGFQAATLSWSSFSAITFAFDVNSKLLTQGIFFAMVIGLIGGLFPAIRAARQPV
ncbi:MAG: ABC transporter permease, partial [Aestuariibacter sp.]|nr:ABC transporter permease [Aestuariibacter sp.]